MYKKRFIIRLTMIFSLFFIEAANAMTDDEADKINLDSCLTYKKIVNQNIIGFIVSKNGVQKKVFDLGGCDYMTYSDGQKVVALSFPTEFITDSFDDGVRPTVLKFRAGHGSGRLVEGEKLFFSYYWKKKPVYNNLGNLVGYEYTFYEQPKSDSSYSWQRYFYWITNVDTGEYIGTVSFNN